MQVQRRIQESQEAIYLLQVEASSKLLGKPALFQQNQYTKVITTSLALTILTGIATAASYLYVLPSIVIISLALTTVALTAFTFYKVWNRETTIVDIYKLFLQGKFREAEDALLLFKKIHGNNVDRIIKEQLSIKKNGDPFGNPFDFELSLWLCINAANGLALNQKPLPKSDIQVLKSRISFYPWPQKTLCNIKARIDCLNQPHTQSLGIKAREVKNLAVPYVVFLIEESRDDLNIPPNLSGIQLTLSLATPLYQKPMSKNDRKLYTSLLPFISEQTVGKNAYMLIRVLSTCQNCFDAFRAHMNFPVDTTALKKKAFV